LFKDKTIDEVLESIELIRQTTQENEAKIQDKDDELRLARKLIESRDEEIKRCIADNRILALEFENSQARKEEAVAAVQKQLDECKAELMVVVGEF